MFHMPLNEETKSPLSVALLLLSFFPFVLFPLKLFLFSLLFFLPLIFFFFFSLFSDLRGSSHEVVANVLVYNIIVSGFKLQSHYHVRFRTKALSKGMNPPLILPAMG